MEFFLAKGFPALKSEEYRFTPITRILEKELKFEVPAGEAVIDPNSLTLLSQASHQLVFVNGRYSAANSRILNNSVKVIEAQAQEPIASADNFDLLNQAFADSVVEIQVAPKQILEEPISIVYYFDNPDFVFANPRWICRIGAHSKLTIAEHTVTQGKSYFNNKYSLIEIGENADVDSGGEISVNNSQVNLAKSSRITSHTFTTRGRMVRNNLTLALNGEGIDARLNGLYLVSENEHVDNHTVVDHRQPNSYSNEVYKGVVDGNGKAVFNGKIFVRPDAQKTNAFQSNRNILLSETGTIHTKPQLEIWADDVKCSHGCTTGQLDEEALFYLRSRGIAKDRARGMLLNAFAGETLNGLKNDALRSYIESVILEKLHPAEPS
jgi:Fe-S cluster assembly protein SufD